MTALLAIVAAIATAEVGADQVRPFALAVHLSVDPSITSRVVRDGFREEAERIWTPYGVRLEWREGPHTDDSGNGFVIEVVITRDRQRPKEPGPTVLGLTTLQRDEPRLSVIRISFNAIVAVLAARTIDRPAFLGAVTALELARALGRVLSHEIGHVLLRLPLHDTTGLMRAVLSPAELADPDRSRLRLASRSVGRLRSRLAALAQFDGDHPIGSGSLQLPQ